MLVANSFDLWQKDSFFSAAEEVQHSADIMESAYRTWIRERREGAIPPQCLDELSRELQMALGTAKWQLQEFERAVRLSYRNRADEVTMTRHSQFVSVLQDQISHVEAALRESFSMEGKQPLQWVNLDEKECDDLAVFLSGIPGISQSTKDDKSTNMTNYCDLNVKLCLKTDIQNQASSFNDVATSNMDSHHAIELEGKETPRTRATLDYHADHRVSNRGTWGSRDISTIDILIEDEDKLKNPPILDIEATSKEKGFKNAFWSPKLEDHPQGKRGIFSLSLCRRTNWKNQLLRRIAGSQRQLQNTPVYSIRFMLALMLTIFLFVPFVLDST